jgi:hypothetical protein
MNNIKLENLEQTINGLQDKIELIGNTLSLIVDELGHKNPQFQTKFISSTLSVDKFREEFTQFVNEEGDDDIKFTMIELNNIVERLKDEQ